MTKRAKVWRVVGSDLLVREGRSLRSPESQGRLAVGAVVKQVSLAGVRLQYRLLTGRGPETGWVSLEVRGRETLVDAGWMTEEAPPEAEAAREELGGGAEAAAQELLALGPEATREDVSSAYRRASVRVHPDRRPDDPEAATRFQELTEARDLLLGRCPEELPAAAEPAVLHGSLPSAQVSGQIWKAVDSHLPEGLVVREGRSLTSPELDSRLCVGAVVEELQRDGERLQYRKLSGTGPEVGWVTIWSKEKELLRAPGLTIDQEKAWHYRQKGHDPAFAVLSMDRALRMLDDLLAAFSDGEFQDRIWRKWAECSYDPDKFGAARFPLVLKVQGPIVAKYGFENSAKGIIDSVVAFWAGEEPLNAFPEVTFKNDMFHYLTDPGKQILAPLGEGGFAVEFCRRLTNVRMAGYYYQEFPFTKPWDARAVLAERGLLVPPSPEEAAPVPAEDAVPADGSAAGPAEPLAP